MQHDGQQSPPITYRAGRAADWPQVREITRQTWEGDDYINAAMWESWAGASEGLLVVAEVDRHIAGFAKITRFGPAEWWLEGLRVAPDRQRTGIGRGLTTHLIAWFEKYGDGMLRVATYSENEASKKLVTEAGLRHTASYKPISAPRGRADYRKFKLLQPHNIAMIDRYLRRSPMYRANRFVEADWKLFYLTHDRLAHYLAASNVQVIGWRHLGELHGLAVLFLAPTDQRDREATDALEVGALCAPDDTTLRAMLHALRGLAAKRGHERVVWKMPVGVGLERVIRETAYQPEWDEGEALWLFERPLRI